MSPADVNYSVYDRADLDDASTLSPSRKHTRPHRTLPHSCAKRLCLGEPKIDHRQITKAVPGEQETVKDNIGGENAASVGTVRPPDNQLEDPK